MWLFTKTGFYSVVRKPGEKRLTIRARARRDLVALKKEYLPELSKIIETDDSDYRYRAHSSPTHLAQATSKIAHEIDYPNFKDEVLLTLGPKRANVYHRIWLALLDLQPFRRPYFGNLRSQGLQADR